MKSFKCRDLGIDCDFESSGETEDQVINNAYDHSHRNHGATELNDDLREKIRSRILDKKQVA